MTHRIEEVVAIGLIFDESTGGWVINPADVDGGSLHAPYEDSPYRECDCANERECRAIQDRAALTPTPSGAELAELLQKAIADRKRG